MSRVLQSFSAPISEEHGWAIIHQACAALTQLHSRHTAPLLLVEAPAQLLLTDDGSVHPDSFTRPARTRRRMSSLAQAVAELGVVVYTALDFSLAEEESRALSSGLEHLIDMMTSADTEHDSSQDMEDEGIGEEERGREVVVAVVELCRHHLAVPAEAGAHYRGVVRALVAEAKELSHFMSRLASLDQDQCVELDRDEWGVIWTDVMTQLRQGVKLKKVDYSKTPVEFSLTPYEMLMDDIRGKKYQLSPVKLPLEVQRDAREVILDFIRSRPPLKSVNKRKVVKRKVELTPQEELMNEIRREDAKFKLKKTTTIERSASGTDSIQLGKVVSKSSSNSNLKKVIDLDQSFAENILNFDDCGEQNEDEYVVQESTLKVNIFLENNPDIKTTNSIQMSTSINTANTNTLAASKPTVTLSEAVPEPSTPGGAKSKYADWIKNLHTLDLTLAEVGHIRYVLTMAELEEMELEHKMKTKMLEGRVCWVCRAAFSWWSVFSWGVACRVCSRQVCGECAGKITLPSDKLQDILVCSLAAQLSRDTRPPSPDSSSGSLSLFSRGRERHSFRATARSSAPVSGPGPDRPRLARARSMDKSMVASLQAMKVSGPRAKPGIQHSVCRDCKDMLTSIVRAQRMAAKLDRMRGGLGRLGHGFDSMRE